MSSSSVVVLVAVLNEGSRFSCSKELVLLGYWSEYLLVPSHPVPSGILLAYRVEERGADWVIVTLDNDDYIEEFENRTVFPFEVDLPAQSAPDAGAPRPVESRGRVGNEMELRAAANRREPLLESLWRRSLQNRSVFVLMMRSGSSQKKASHVELGSELPRHLCSVRVINGVYVHTGQKGRASLCITENDLREGFTDQ